MKKVLIWSKDLFSDHGDTLSLKIHTFKKSMGSVELMESMLTPPLGSKKNTNEIFLLLDINECEQVGDHNGHFCTQANSICVNTFGSYKCK